MKYLEFTLKPRKGNKAKISFRGNKGNGWESGGDWATVFYMPEHIVLFSFIKLEPIAVFNDLEGMKDYFIKRFALELKIQNI